MAAGAKQRFADDKVVISSVIGEVADRDVIVLDDEIAKGSTVFELLARLRERNVRSVRVACTHGLFAGGRDASGCPRRRTSRRSSARTPCRSRRHDRTDKLTVLSVAPALAEAMRRIHNGESVSALFA